MADNNLLGQRFGRLTIISGVTSDDNRNARWLCLCECGTSTIVAARNLKSGGTRSCGCLHDEASSSRWRSKKHPNYKHGDCTRKGAAPEFMSWVNMLSRCYNPKAKNFQDYGGRGITVCDDWHNYVNFLSSMGRRPSPYHSIERIDNNGGYDPLNCRWATRKEQANNRRTNHNITFNNHTMTMTEWARRAGIKRSTLWMRIIHYGWPIEKALNGLGSAI